MKIRMLAMLLRNALQFRDLRQQCDTEDRYHPSTSSADRRTLVVVSRCRALFFTLEMSLCSITIGFRINGVY